jgi:hypothetical protein
VRLADTTARASPSDGGPHAWQGRERTAVGGRAVARSRHGVRTLLMGAGRAAVELRVPPRAVGALLEPAAMRKGRLVLLQVREDRPPQRPFRPLRDAAPPRPAQRLFS